MEDVSQTTKEEETQPETEETVEENKKPEQNTKSPLSIIDEARAERMKIQEVLDNLKKENDRGEQILARSFLGGQTEGRIPIKKPEEISPQEYSRKLQRGEINPFK